MRLAVKVASIYPFRSLYVLAHCNKLWLKMEPRFNVEWEFVKVWLVYFMS